MELQLHGGSGWRTYWTWTSKKLCPPCKAAQLDFWFPKQIAAVRNAAVTAT
jgi:hypothetical protein